MATAASTAKSAADTAFGQRCILSAIFLPLLPKTRAGATSGGFAPLRAVAVLVLCALAASTVSGCAITAPSRQELRMDSYVGGQAAEMIRDRGIPVKSYEREGGGMVYVWQECRLVYDRNGEQWPHFCETKAYVNPDGTVERWNWRGNECPLLGVESGCDLPLWFW